MWRLRSIACYPFFILLLAGCAAENDELADTSDTECTRLDAAVEGSTLLFRAIPDMQKKAIDDCRKGDPLACIAAPGAIPFTALLATAYAPFGFVIGFAFEDAQTALCEGPGLVVSSRDRMFLSPSTFQGSEDGLGLVCDLQTPCPGRGH